MVYGKFKIYGLEIHGKFLNNERYLQRCNWRLSFDEHFSEHEEKLTIKLKANPMS